MTLEDAFTVCSREARHVAEKRLRALWTDTDTRAVLAVLEPSAPLAVFAAITSSDGQKLAEVSARAHAANVLIGETGALCALDGGSIEERAEQLYGAVAAVLAIADGKSVSGGPDSRSASA